MVAIFVQGLKSIGYDISLCSYASMLFMSPYLSPSKWQHLFQIMACGLFRHQAIVSIDAGLLSIGLLGKNHLKMPSAKMVPIV